MDWIFLGKASSKGALEGVKIGEERVDERGGRCASEEEGCFNVFVGEGCFFSKSAGGAGVLWFTYIKSVLADLIFSSQVVQHTLLEAW